MLLLQLIVDGIVSGCAVGVVALTFSYIYSVTGVFHVAHAGVYTLGGYVTWWLTGLGAPFGLALLASVMVAGALGILIQKTIYERLARSKAPPLVLLIASLGVLAVCQNIAALLFTPNVVQFSLPWRLTMNDFGPVSLSTPQILTVVSSVAILVVLTAFSERTQLGSRIRAVASNPQLAEIVRLRPYQVYVYVVGIASGLVAISSSLVGLDQAMQPFTSVLVLLTAVIAVIAGGIGSLRGAFIVSLILSVLQNMILVMVPGRWSIAFTFGLFILFILVMPTGLFKTRLRRAS
jgi:branched-chain amino acid transport system permease protein